MYVNRFHLILYDEQFKFTKVLHTKQFKHNLSQGPHKMGVKNWTGGERKLINNKVIMEHLMLFNHSLITRFYVIKK